MNDNKQLNNQTELFNEPEIKPVLANGRTCKTCEHRQRWECNSKVIQFCGVRPSKRTDNGLTKIKCKTPACHLYKPCG